LDSIFILSFNVKYGGLLRLEIADKKALSNSTCYQEMIFCILAKP